MLKKISRISSTKHRVSLAIEFSDVNFSRKSTAVPGTHVVVAFEKGEKKVSTTAKLVEESGVGAKVTFDEMITFNATLYKDKENRTTEKSCEFILRQKMSTRSSDIGKFSIKLHELEESIPCRQTISLQNKHGASLNATIELIVTMTAAVGGDDASSRASSEFSRESLGGSFSMPRILPVSRKNRAVSRDADSQSDKASLSEKALTSPTRSTTSEKNGTEDSSELTALKNELQKALADKENVEQYHQDSLVEIQDLRGLIDLMKRNRNDEVQNFEDQLEKERESLKSKDAEITRLRVQVGRLHDASEEANKLIEIAQAKASAAEVQAKMYRDQVDVLREELNEAKSQNTAKVSNGVKALTLKTPPRKAAVRETDSPSQFLNDDDAENAIQELETERKKVAKLNEHNNILLGQVEELLSSAEKGGITPRTLRDLQENCANGENSPNSNSQLDRALKLIVDLETRNKAYASTIAILESSKSDLNREQGKLLDQIDELRRERGEVVGDDETQFAWMKQAIDETNFGTPSPDKSPREGAGYLRSRLSSMASVDDTRGRSTSDLSAELRIVELEETLSNTREELDKTRARALTAEEETQQVDILKEHVNELRSQLQKEQSSSQKSVDELKRRSSMSETELQRVKSNAEFTASEVSILKCTISDLEAQLESTEKLLAKSEEQLAKTEKELLGVRKQAETTISAGKAYYEGEIAGLALETKRLKSEMKGLQIQIEEQERSLADAQKEVRAASEEVDSVNNALSASETECSQLRGEIASLKSQNDILSKNASAASVREVSSSSKSMTQRHRFSSTAKTDDEDDEYDGEGSELEDKRRSPRAPQVDSMPKKANLLKIPNAYEQTVPILLNYVDAFPDLWHIFVESLYMSHNCTPMYEEWKETCIQIIPNLEGFLDKLESSALGSSTEGMESSEAKLINQHNESILELIACQREWISHLHEALYKITSHSEVIGAKGGSRQSSPKRASSTAANKLWANIDEEGGETAVIPEADLQALIQAKLQLAESLEANDKMQKEYRQVEKIVCDYKLRFADLLSQIDDKNAEIVALTKANRLLKQKA